MSVNSKLEALGGIMAYPGSSQPSDVADKAIAVTDKGILLTDGMITQHDEVRLGSNNTSKEKTTLAKTD